jgi:hypothetical protein
MYHLFSGVASKSPWPYTMASSFLPSSFVMARDIEFQKPESELTWFKKMNQIARLEINSLEDMQAIHGTVLVDSSENGILVLAERSGGKSTTAVAWSQLTGLPVLCDDLTVIKEHQAFIGPRLLPVRPNTARMLGLNPTGNCLPLKDAPVQAPIVCAYFLRTGGSFGIEELSQKQARYELSRRLFDSTKIDQICANLRGVNFHRITRPFN